MTVKSKTHFTILIPTRERKDTLIHTINSALSQDYENFTVLVSDNASTDGTTDLIHSIGDPRLKYINTGKRVSMSHNWEFGLDHIDDGWVTILGDDDAILPGTLSKVEKIISETGTQAVRSNGCSFRWPCLENSNYGTLTLSVKTGYKRVCSRNALLSALNGDMSYTDLPVLYNGGFVDFSVLRKAKEISGQYIKSMCPDIYLGVILALLTSEYVYSEEPLAINGASQHSGGTASHETSKVKREYDPSLKFFTEENIPFHPAFPLMPNGTPVRSLQVLLYEAYSQALPFHFLHKIFITPKQQLTVVLKQENNFMDDVLIFSKMFAKQHNLDFDKIYSIIPKENFSGLKNIGLRLFKWPIRQVSRINSLWSKSIGIYGNAMLPLANVYEASIVAGLLKEIPVGGPVWNLKNIIKTRKLRDAR